MMDRNVMIRIPKDLVPELERLALVAKGKLGVDRLGVCEVNRSFIHHLALRLGLAALERDLTKAAK